MAFNLGAVTATLTAKDSGFQQALQKAGQALSNLGKQTEQVDLKMKAYENSVNNITRSQGLLNTKMAEMTTAGKQGTTAFTALENRSKSLNERLSMTTAKMADYNWATMNAGVESNRFNQAISGLASGGIGLAIGGVQNLAGFVMDLGQKGFQVATTGALALGAGLAGLIGYATSLASKIQSSRIGIQTALGGDKALTDNLMKQITAFSQTTPFNRLELIDYSKTLIGVGFEYKSIIPTLDKLGNVASATGYPLDMLIRNYGQIRSAQQAYTRDINEFSTYGVPIWDKLSKNMGITVAQLRDGIDKNKIKVSFDDIDKALSQMTGKGGQYFQLMQQKSKTFEGALSNIQDVTQLLLLRFMGVSDTGEVIAGGFFDKIQNSAFALMDWLTVNGDMISGWGARVFNAIGNGISFAWTNLIQPKLLEFQNWFNNGGKQAIIDWVTLAWQKLQNAFNYFTQTIWPTLYPYLQQFATWMSDKERINDLANMAKGFMDICTWVYNTVDALGQFIGKAKEAKASFDSFDKKASAGIMTAINPVGAFTKNIFGRASGGPVNAGQLYEVGEQNKAEMFMSGGKQYMIPGNDGQVLNQNQMTKNSNIFNTFNISGSQNPQAVAQQVIQMLARQNTLANSGVGLI